MLGKVFYCSSSSPRTFPVTSCAYSASSLKYVVPTASIAHSISSLASAKLSFISSIRFFTSSGLRGEPPLPSPAAAAAANPRWPTALTLVAVLVVDVCAGDVDDEPLQYAAAALAAADRGRFTTAMRPLAAPPTAPAARVGTRHSCVVPTAKKTAGLAALTAPAAAAARSARRA